MSFQISIGKLTPHPLNKDIYGDESDSVQELAELIRNSGHIVPLVINQDNVIISGHRRYLACVSLKIKEIPVEKITFNDESEELERLLVENQYREKTTYQKEKEAERWEVIEKEKAKKRQGTRTDLIDDIVDTSPPCDSKKSRDIIAGRVGLGSGKTHERAKPTVKKIDELKDSGNTKDSEFLKAILNDNVSAAKDLSALESLDSISEELKDQVINKEVPVKAAVQAIRKDLAILKEDTKAEELTKLEDNENTVLPSAHLSTPIEELKTDDATDTCNSDSIIAGLQLDVSEFVKVMSKHISMEDLYEELSKADKNKVREIMEDVGKVINKIKNFVS